ncbi:DUF3515 family protein [Microbacterium kunmingense]|uniref:DUF3515 family protein n=1 Tax=Microbacterium kunmingense TaxID=2915939 RepID=UPI0020053F64|nr:DUF3515 family protein [Microbacterium kunmingense]
MTRARNRRNRLRAVTSLAVVALSAPLLSCSNTVSLTPAENANSPDCARVTVSLPDSVENEDRRWTDAQSTGAWGNPVSIILTCGVKPPGPSELPCFYLGGTDWLALPQETNLQRVVTFGRDPAVEVAIARTGGLDFAAVLEALGGVVDAALPVASAECTDRTDVRTAP